MDGRLSHGRQPEALGRRDQMVMKDLNSSQTRDSKPLLFPRVKRGKISGGPWWWPTVFVQRRQESEGDWGSKNSRGHETLV